MDLIRLKTFRLHGAAKFFHTLFMIVTYPLRHIFVFFDLCGYFFGGTDCASDVIRNFG